MVPVSEQGGVGFDHASRRYADSVDGVLNAVCEQYDSKLEENEARIAFLEAYVERLKGEKRKVESQPRARRWRYIKRFPDYVKANTGFRCAEHFEWFLSFLCNGL